MAYISLRLPFGVANGPNDHNTIREPIFHLTNEIVQDKNYHRDKLHSPLQKDLKERSKSHIKDTPFTTTKPLFVKTSFHFTEVDGYIDGIIAAVLDIRDWAKKVINAAPLVIHSIFGQKIPKIHDNNKNP